MRMRKNAKKSFFDGWNCAPNIVTYVRIVLSLVFIVLYLLSGEWGFQSVSLRWAAFALFVIAAVTDKLDGWMARKYHQVTELGKLLDPIADKILVLSALVIASIFNEIYWWITILFLVREISITLVRFYVIKRGGKVIPASSAGKYKTLTQTVGISMILLPMVAMFQDVQLPSWVISYYAVAFGLLGISLGFAFYSAVLYVYSAFFEKNSDDSHADESRLNDSRFSSQSAPAPLPPLQ